ncbi:menaquinone biosynthesis protein [Desulfotomaculum nigrificans CO-1-SRB]|uniref:Cyclic dehypoxanthine futalosine synthase n=1 Tax=Desulfotomaculum nigrificans (strain DSM 14880 / VKM B-2319 / CO-1-SRB) TaxID=868595 RepID=F6B712_DESCC|nr:cyclic dehypoxanthinyl futalosine synthase [Desulfotomaculum nigrificans]AEF94437.1 menaquinone biosynthesis protein [Desulfotomaculum nigrificans CO-1-SRB]
MKRVSNVEEILNKAVAGQRLTVDEGVTLMKSADLISLGAAANAVRRRLHPDNHVTFIIDRNINYTNICYCKCRFCAFWREPDAPDAYVISQDELFTKIDETIAVGGTELLIQGGLHPELGLDYYVNLLRSIKERYDIHIHSFSPPEIWHIARKSGVSIREALQQLHQAGLDSLPGGGAEILDNRVRKAISPNKISWEEWMEVMTTAHSIGMKTTATMMFGHVETTEERVLHMVRVREAQDKTGGFTAFIPWSFQPRNTALGGETTDGVDYLRTLAVARLMLDNVKNIQASWVTQGAKLAQISLSFGANDFGSTMLEENVVRAAGVTYRVPLEEILRCIREAGFRPAQRTTDYRIIKEL